MNKVLIVVAHGDDETLGMGGTIARHHNDGDEIRLIVMSDGVSARKKNNIEHENDKRQRYRALNQAANILGINKVYNYDFPDNQMDTISLLSIVQKIEEVFIEYPAKTVYTHSVLDLNIDHQITHKAVMTACRPQKHSSVKKILTFEVLSSTEWNSSALPQFNPQYIIDIADYWETKVQALQCYQEEMRTFPHSRSIECVEALATLRGATHGFAKAEAFFVERILESD
ncbi:PIG-L family deacetylase [Paraglaciecola sp.]|nr:PIG-L family deacetylase [Paraglaciecola sp.]